MKLLIFLTMLMSTLSIQAKDDSTKEILKFIKTKKNVLVHVHATWCPSCKMQKKILSQIDKKNFNLLEVDFDSDKKFLKQYKIFQQSMLVAFNDGVEANRVFGITKEKKIKKFTDENFEYSLQAEIDKKRSGSKVPDKARMTMAEATQELRDSGIIDKAVKKGDKFIDFSLPNINGKAVKISELLKDGPIILTFYRGGWCPYCNLQLKAYQDFLPEFKKAGAQLVAISPESMESANTTVEKHDLQFEILTDDMNKIARKYGLVFKLSEKLKEVYLKFGLDLEKNQGNDSWELPVPATYVINKDGKIIYSFLNVDYIQRAEPRDILSTLK